MATKFSDIYELFLGQIDDYTIVELDDEEVEILIEKYLINGLITVYSQLADTLDIEHAKKEFTSDLPLFIKNPSCKINEAWMG